MTGKSDGKTQGPHVVAKTTPAKVKAIKKEVVDRETLRLVETQLRHVTKGFDAVSILFQYLVNDVSTIITIIIIIYIILARLPLLRTNDKNVTAVTAFLITLVRS